MEEGLLIMKRILIAAAACAACALASSQPVIVPPHDGDHMDNRDLDRGDQMKRPDSMIQQQARADDRAERHDERHEEHHQQKVWVPSHNDHDKTDRGHYEWR
jgi:hypothetical protein